MKIKASKKVQPTEAKLHQLKKSKSDIVKPKEKKSAGLMAAAVTPHTFAEKKVLAVKKKNKKDKLAELGKTKSQISTGQVPPKKHESKPEKGLGKQQKAPKADASKKNKVKFKFSV